MKTIEKLDLEFLNKSEFPTCHASIFPIESYFSFKPLIKFWKKQQDNPNKYKSYIANKIIEYIDDHPEFYEPIENPEYLNAHKEIVDLMMGAIYPLSSFDKAIVATIPPFKLDKYFSTPLFDQMFGMEKVFNLIQEGTDTRKMVINKIINAYVLIVKKFYNYDIKFNLPFVLGTSEENGKLEKYYQLQFDLNFIDIEVKGKLPEISKDTFRDVFNDFANLDKWIEILPPDKFKFYGFASIYFIDITEQQTISLLRHDLLANEAIKSFDRLKSIRNKIRSFTGLPDVKIGLAAFPSDKISSIGYARKIGDSFVLNDNYNLTCEDLNDSIYDRAFTEKKPILIENLVEFENKTPVEKAVLDQGIKSLLVIPLHLNDRIIGVLEIGSPNPCEINMIISAKLQKVYSLFLTTIERSLDELENKVQGIIKEECTAIHSSVEWRFREAAYNLINQTDHEEQSELESIVFENVYPLYGVSDIRDSSFYRNEAIKHDLVEHLDMVSKIINKAKKIENLPYYNEMNYRISKQAESINKQLNSGDEVHTIDFLQNEVHSLFEHLAYSNPELKKLITEYNSKINPQLQIYYNKRKEYEESVNTINEMISSYLDDAEIKSQKMFPHYFEKYKTDGVEHGIYIGQSLVNDKIFNELYVKNLRLWQLIVTCGIAMKAEKIKEKLSVPLELTHLILVQTSPLAIRFRADEKKFDVDGTYNIRYEIMKKRIDKAVIKGSTERITQPGKIAIIYSQNKEKKEYKKYIEYLQSQDLLKDQIDDLEVSELQGVQGLKALRVEVNYENSEGGSKIDEMKINTVVNSFGELVKGG